jgi:hypothetical protein
LAPKMENFRSKVGLDWMRAKRRLMTVENSDLKVKVPTL